MIIFSVFQKYTESQRQSDITLTHVQKESQKQPQNTSRQDRSKALSNEFKSASSYSSTVNERNLNKGYIFERYVISLFEKNNRPDRRYFEIADWTRDINRKTTGVNVLSNLNPDLVICYNRREYFAVECKYRQNLFYSDGHEGKVLEWSSHDQIKRYQAFQRERNMSVFIVIGVGGTPDNPKQMYCIPLNEARTTLLNSNYLHKYWRNPHKPFFWRDNHLY